MYRSTFSKELDDSSDDESEDVNFKRKRTQRSQYLKENKESWACQQYHGPETVSSVAHGNNQVGSYSCACVCVREDQILIRNLHA